MKEGLSFCLSLPLDFRAATFESPSPPPRQFATVRDSGKNAGAQNFCYPRAEDNPDITMVCDDVVLMKLQYSTQWDIFAHVGSLFDADGDGTPEIVFYNGFRARSTSSRRRRRKASSAGRNRGRQGEALGIQNLAAHGAQGRG